MVAPIRWNPFMGEDAIPRARRERSRINAEEATRTEPLRGLWPLAGLRLLDRDGEACVLGQDAHVEHLHTISAGIRRGFEARARRRLDVRL